MSFNKHLPWLIDSLEALNEERKRWAGHRDHDPAPLLQIATSLTSFSLGMNRIVLHKLDTIIVLLSAGMIEHMNEHHDEGQSGKSANKTLALALVNLADAAIKNRPISKLVAAQLLKPIDGLVMETHIENDRDLLVGLACAPSHTLVLPLTGRCI